MFSAIKKIWILLGRSIYTGERLRKNMLAITFLGCVIAMVGTGMTIINIVQDKGLVTVTTAVIAVLGLTAAFCSYFLNNRNVCIWIAVYVSVFIFTYYAVLGVNEGFAILWTMLVPVVFCYFLSVKYGLFLSLYYEILFIVMGYSPLRAEMLNYYTETFLNRFPLLFLCSMILNSTAMIQYHISTLFQIDHENTLNEEVEKQTVLAEQKANAVEKLSFQMIEALATSIDAKDRYTNGHSYRVAQYAVMMARQLGYSDKELKILKQEGLLHDIGKIGVPDVVLNKSGKLTDEEYFVVQSHTSIGGDILQHLEDFQGAADVARYHHERFDGKGYPSGLSGKCIPEHVRIVSIADAYDAMYSDRIYRKGMDKKVIRDEILTYRGKQFDPELTDIFLKLFDEGKLTAIDAYGRAFPIAENGVRIKNMITAAVEDEIRIISEGSGEDAGFDDEKITTILNHVKERCRRDLMMIVLKVSGRDGCSYSKDQLDDTINAIEYAVGRIYSVTGGYVHCGQDLLLLPLYRMPDKEVKEIIRKIYLEFYRLANSNAFEITNHVLGVKD
jgi:putative nucleotidyltransferase with HDIG domain